MSDVKVRLQKFIREIGITTVEFEKTIGVSNGYVNGISKSIQPDKLKKISDLYPSLNFEWLLIGKGKMIKGDYRNIGIVGNHNKADNIVSGNNNAVNVGNGNSVNVTLPEKGKSKIINDKGIEMTYESLPDENTQQKYSLLLEENRVLREKLEKLQDELKETHKDLIRLLKSQTT